MPEVMSIEVDEEFDPRPPSSPFGLIGPDGKPNYGMIAGIIIAVILILMLIFVVIKPFGGNEKPVVVSKWSPKDPTKNLNFLESYPASSPMVVSIQASLDSWALYFTTGNLNDLSTTFDLAGNQYAQLMAMQPQIAANPEEGLPARIELGPVGKVSRKDDLFTVRVVVNWTKPGQETSEKRWDIDMKAHESKFILSTVRETNPKDKQPIDFCGAVAVVAGLDGPDVLREELAKFPPEQKKEKLLEVYKIKVRAWTYLLDAVDATDSDADVRAIVDEYQLVVDKAKIATSVDEILTFDSGADISSNLESISQRAEQECSKNILNK